MGFEFPNQDNIEESVKEELKEADDNANYALLFSSMGGNINEVEKLLKKFKYDEESSNLAVQGCFEHLLSVGNIDEAEEIYKKYQLSKDNLQETIQEKFIKRLDDGYQFDSRAIGEKFNLSNDFIQEVVQQKFNNSLSGGRIATAQTTKDIFNLSNEFINSEEVKEASKKGFIKSLSFGEHLAFKNYEDSFDFSNEFITSNEVKKAAQAGFINHLENSSVIRYDFLEHLKEKFGLSDKFTQKSAERGFSANLRGKHISDAKEIGEKFNLSDEFIQEITQDKFIFYLNSGSSWQIEIAKEIEEKFGISKDFIYNEEKKASILYFEKGNIDKFIFLKEKYNVKLEAKELINAVSKLNSFLLTLKEKVPNIYENCSTDINTIINLSIFLDKQDDFFKLIEESPFLENAIKSDSKYGNNLLLKFNEFDDISKENIKSLFDWKKEILNNNPNINENSPEFRKLIQEKIKLYKNNPDIIEELKKEEINIENWLNYKEEDKFTLNERELVDFSKIIETPLNRINESVFKYIDNINLILGEFMNELKNHETYSDEYLKSFKLLEDIRKRINDEKSNSNPDQEKIKGMEKGFVDLNQKLERIKDKKISLYDKIQLKLSSLNRSCEEVKKINEELITLEKGLNDNYSKEINNKILKTKENLKKKFFSLKYQFEYFNKENELSGIVSEVLGKERVEAINQEMGEILNENFNHMQTDIADLSKIFIEKQKENNIEGKRMGINAWNRNPDIDLYQGNYSPCCISIESGCGSSSNESTISDYMTDLAIQIVNVKDEEKGIPIIAAWCWLGKDELGNKCFVIDNVETNTDYTNKYPQLLSKKLRDYIKNYAGTVGFGEDEIFQGDANNDIILGFNSPRNKKIIKIGPSNRSGGYYLEAEGR